MSYSQIVKEHQRKNAKRNQNIENLREEAAVCVNKVSGKLYDSVNRGVAQVYNNQQRLDTETKKLQSETSRFAKQTNEWVNMYKSFNESLKELGDVGNWAQSMETDMTFVASALQQIVQERTEANARPPSPVASTDLTATE